MNLFKYVPLTKLRVLTAKVIYKAIVFIGIATKQKVRRNDVNYLLDLSDGIDLKTYLLGGINLNIYLFGGFQSQLYKSLNLGPNSIIIDIGANIGCLTLEFAKIVNDGKGVVISIEPTDSAFEKLKNNVSLNPNLSKKISLIKAFVSSKNREKANGHAYSSWRLDNNNENNSVHPLHLGQEMPATATPMITVDTLTERRNLERLDLIKISTDGDEFDVLIGATTTIKKYRPIILFECGEYLLLERGQSFKDFIQFFEEHQYKVVTTDKKQVITKDNYKEIIPHSSTIDLFAFADD